MSSRTFVSSKDCSHARKSHMKLFANSMSTLATRNCHLINNLKIFYSSIKVYLLNFPTQGLEFAYMLSSACLHMVYCLPNMEICDKNDDLRSVIWGRECF